MKAVIIKEQGVAALADIEEQPMRPDYIKVKTVALAVNPTDLVHTAGAGPVGSILGCDFSGIVEEVGSECKSDVKKGDAIFGMVHGANNSAEDDGAFAEYTLVRDGHFAKIPENVSFEEAATLGVGIITMAQTLYFELQYPIPGEKPLEGENFLLIYGGSTASGTLAIQFAKLSGLTVITTASPSNFELLKSRGADAVFDYHDPECAQKIKEYTKGKLHNVLDCISTESSYRLIADALPETSEPMKVVTLLPADSWPRKDVEVVTILAYTTIGKPFFKFGIDFPEIPSHYEHVVMFWKLSQELLAAGKLKPHPVSLQDGGLAGIPYGIAQHAENRVSAVKLVYRVSDTKVEVSGEGPSVAPRKMGSNW